MIKKVTKTYGTTYFPLSFTYEVSDFKDGEEPRCTGFKRNYRKAKWSKYDHWTERYEIRPRCWKNQSKRRHQYHRIVDINLYTPFERDECGIVITDEMIDEMCYLANTYGPAVLGL